MFATFLRIMKLKTLTPTLSLVAVASAAGPAVAAAAPVSITGFSVSPACVTPGGTVTATATVQNTTGFPVSFYSQSWVTEGGVTVYRGGAQGAYNAPAYVPVTQSQNVQIPSYTPWGYYTLNLGVGPSSSDATSWSQRSAPLTVSPYCWFH